MNTKVSGRRVIFLICDLPDILQVRQDNISDFTDLIQ